MIRPERADDPAEVRAIAELLEATFGETIQRRLVDAMRRAAEYRPNSSLVAARGSRIVGYVMVSGATLAGPGSRRAIASLAPLAVAADEQGRGVGSRLIEAVVAATDDGTVPVLVLEGNLAYYGRYGFEPGGPLGIASHLLDFESAGAPLVRRLSAYAPTVTGLVEYPHPFRETLDATTLDR